MTVIFAPEAEEDFRALIDYLHERNPAAAAAFSERIFAVVERLSSGAFDGPEQHLRTGEAVRSWAIPPVRLYYQRTDDVLWVLRIYHQARSPITR